MADKIYDVGRFRHSIDNWQLSMLLGIIFFIVGIVVFFRAGRHLSRAFRAVRDRRDSLGRFRTVFGYEGSHRVGHGMVHRRRCNRNPAGYPAAVHPVDALHDPAVRARLLAPLPGDSWPSASPAEMMGGGYQGAGWTMTLGILVIISAFLVLFNPIIGVGVVVFWVGLSLLLAGVDLIAHAVTLRRLRKEL